MTCIMYRHNIKAMRTLIILFILLNAQFLLGSPSLIPFRQNNKWGYSNRNKQIIIKCIYDEALPFSQGLGAVRSGTSWSFLNTKGKVIASGFENVYSFSDGRAAIKKGNKWGYINRLGKVVIPIIYSLAGNFIDNRAWVTDSTNKAGFIKKSGQLITDIIYTSWGEFSQGRCWVQNGNTENPNVIFIKRNGKPLTERKYFFARDFNNNRAVVKCSAGSGYINRRGKEVIKSRYDYCFSFSNGLALVIQNKDYYVINKKGKQLFKLDYSFDEAIGHYSFNRLAVVKDGKAGYLNKKNHLITGLSFDTCNIFSDGLAAAKIQGKWGFVNKQGRLIIPTKYDTWFITGMTDLGDQGYYFKNGLCKVRYHGKEGYIDKNGNEYWQ